MNLCDDTSECCWFVTTLFDATPWCVQEQIQKSPDRGNFLIPGQVSPSVIDKPHLDVRPLERERFRCAVLQPVPSAIEEIDREREIKREGDPVRQVSRAPGPNSNGTAAPIALPRLGDPQTANVPSESEGFPKNVAHGGGGPRPFATAERGQPTFVCHPSRSPAEFCPARVQREKRPPAARERVPKLSDRPS